MAKMNGFVGGLSGKFGNAVFRQRGGKTIATQYQPVVANPSTDKQCAQRVKFKLLSQLGAIFSPHLGGFKTQSSGNKVAGSQRNAFFKANYPLVTGDAETARIEMNNVKLTESLRTLGDGLNINFPSSGIVQVNVGNINADVEYLHVVIVDYSSDGMGVNERPARIIAAATLPYTTDGVLVPAEIAIGTRFTVLAYGIIPLTSNTTNDYENIHTPTDQYTSEVKLQRDVLYGNVAVTETLGGNDLRER